MSTSKMSEQTDATASASASVNGAPSALDLKATKAALTSSSTSSRIAQLRVVDDKISQKGMGHNPSVTLLPVDMSLDFGLLLTVGRSCSSR